jgi:hypothetical protein
MGIVGAGRGYFGATVPAFPCPGVLSANPYFRYLRMGCLTHLDGRGYTEASSPLAHTLTLPGHQEADGTVTA